MPSRCPRGQLPPLLALHIHTGRPARRSRNWRGRPAGHCVESAPRQGRSGPGGSPQEPLGHTLSTRGRMFPRKGVVGSSTPNSRRPPGVTTPKCPRATRDAVSQRGSGTDIPGDPGTAGVLGAAPRHAGRRAGLCFPALTGPEDRVLAGGPPEWPCLRDRAVSVASREI